MKERPAKKQPSEKRVKLMALMMKIADYLLVGLISLVCSLLVITIGAAAAAFYTVGVAMVRGEEGSVYKDYFATFKAEFRRMTPIWLVLLLVQLLIAANAVFYFWLASGGAAWAQFGLGVCAIAALFLSFACAFLFPIYVKNDDMRGIDAVRVSMFLAGRQFGWWAAKTVVQTALFAATWFFPFLIILAPGALLFWNSFCYDRAFKKQFSDNHPESTNII